MQLAHTDRRYGVLVAAARGTGKSRFLGRYLGFFDFLAGIPTIVIDNGDTIDNILDRISRLPDDMQKNLWPRVRYLDLAGSDGRVVPFPLYYRLGEESDRIVAERFARTILKVDPELRSASVQGKTAIMESVYETGVELVRNGWQVSEIDQIPVKPAPTYRVRLLPILLDDTQKAMFCASKPGIDWQKVIDKQQLILINYQFVEDPEFLLTWILDYLSTFLKYRGTGKSPISLIIDELYAFQASQSHDSMVFFKDLQLLINTTMRRYNLWLTVGLQDLGQFSDPIQDLLLTLETQLIGRTLNMNSARKLAERFYRVDPLKIKRYQVSQWSVNPVEYSLQEQIEEAAYVFMDELPQFTFIAKMRSGRVIKTSYADYERGIYPRPQIVARSRYILIKRDTPQVETILAEIAARIPKQLPPPPVDTKPNVIPVRPPTSPAAAPLQAPAAAPSTPPTRPRHKPSLRSGDEVE